MAIFLDAAERVLNENGNRPLHCKDMTDIALQKGYLPTQGQTPAETMSARLATDVKQPISRFIRVAPGTYRLKLSNELTQQADNDVDTYVMSTVEVIERIFQENNNQPMHCKKIAEIAQQKGYLRSGIQNPDKTVSDRLWIESQPGKLRFKRLERGIYCPYQTAEVPHEKVMPKSISNQKTPFSDALLAEEITDIKRKLDEYRNEYLKEDSYHPNNEAETCMLADHFLAKVLGYKPVKEIKGEDYIHGGYADRVVVLDNIKQIIIEVKAMNKTLKDQHLRQCLSYASQAGVTWMILFNGRHIRFDRVIFSDPVRFEQLFEHNLQDAEQIHQAATDLVHFSQIVFKRTTKEALVQYWAKRNALASSKIAQLIYTSAIVKSLKRTLKAETAIAFKDNEIADILKQVIQNANNIDLEMKE